MLKGLLTRKVFALIDVALVALVLLVLWMVGRELTWTMPQYAGSGPDTSEVAAPEFATIASRDTYNVILDNRLFGDAGIVEKKVEAPAPVAPTVTTEETNFKELRLVATSLTKPFPNAMIARLDTGEAKVYWPGDDVIPGRAKVDEIKNRVVVLQNLEKNQMEVLRMDPEPGEAGPGAAVEGPGGPPPPPPPTPNSMELKREEIAQELENLTTNMAEVSNTLNPRPHQDETGKTIGYTADNISTIPLARRMGLQDGDVVTQINGINIDSMQKITDVIGKFENSPSFHIKVLRQGKPMLLQYRLTE